METKEKDIKVSSARTEYQNELKSMPENNKTNPDISAFNKVSTPHLSEFSFHIKT